MPRGKKLTEEEQGKIRAFKEAGLSNREIGRRIGRSRTPINNFLNDPKGYNAVHAGGRPKVLSERDERQIIRELKKNRRTSIGQLKAKTKVNASNSTVRRFLRKKDIRRKKMKGQPRLSNDHKQRRLQFAKEHQTWDKEWTTVIFSDEKKWNLDGPDGYKHYWSSKDMSEITYSRRQNAGGGIMVWGGICANGKLPLIIIDGKFNALRYIEMLDDAGLSEEGIKLCGEDFVFQQDNAPIHTARATMDYFHAMGIKVLTWPARSPDINPIENAWGWLSHEVYKDGKQYDSVEELKKAVLKCWDNIPMEYLQKLISSMKNRVFEIIKQNGGQTHY